MCTPERSGRQTDHDADTTVTGQPASLNSTVRVTTPRFSADDVRSRPRAGARRRTAVHLAQSVLREGLLARLRGGIDAAAVATRLVARTKGRLRNTRCLVD